MYIWGYHMSKITSIPIESKLIKSLMLNENKDFRLGLLDRFLDLFRSIPKRVILQQFNDLVERFSDKDNPQMTFAYRFFIIREMLDDTDKFRMSISGTKIAPDTYKLSYDLFLDDKKIQLLEEVVDQNNLNNAKSCWGEFSVHESQQNAIDHDLNRIKDLTLSTPYHVISLLDKNIFNSTSKGCNKLYQDCCQFGLLQIPNKIADRELAPEDYIDNLSQNIPEIQRYVSTQRKLAEQSIPELNNSEYVYAIVPSYDTNEVNVSTLQDMFKKDNVPPLSFSECKSIVRQLIDVTRVFYKNNISHGDLHMGNIQVIRENFQTIPNYSESLSEGKKVYIRTFDFGRLQKESAFKNNKNRDIDYLFFRQGDGALETLVRNVIIPKDSEKYQKHYPIHHLIDRFNTKKINIASHIKSMGEVFTSQLSKITDPNEVDCAFNKVANDLLDFMDRCYEQDCSDTCIA